MAKNLITTDKSLAATLVCKGQKLIEVDYLSLGREVYIFQWTEEFQEVCNQFFDNQLKIEPKRFLEAVVEIGDKARTEAIGRAEF